MSGTLTLAAGQVFTGGTSLSAGDTGQIALTEIGSVTFSSGATPTISDVTITQDAAASSIVYDEPFVGDIFIQAVTIDAVTTGTSVTLTTSDLPPGITVPPGFTLPQTVTGTTLDVTVQTNMGDITGTGQVGVYGYSGNEVLVGVENLTVDGLNVNVGAAILSLGVQPTGTISATFTPSFSEAPCFAAGTRIHTPAGEVPVEVLAPGDIVLLADGGTAKVQWLGHRGVDCRGHKRPTDVLPVRIAAGAFGPRQPVQDLRLSPDHSVFVDGVLVPVRYLINGATVIQETAENITYWHVELDRHNVILAEGLPCETYLDTGNRGAFSNGSASVQMHPDFALRIWDAEACAPLVLGGPRLVAAKRHLLTQATALGYPKADDAELRVEVNGRTVVAETDGRQWRVRLPEAAENVRITSRVWIPAQMRADEEDMRPLGVAISRIWLDGREVSLESQGLAAGWHAPEPGWRWTDGDATLVPSGARELAFEVAMTGTYWRCQEHREARAA